MKLHLRKVAPSNRPVLTDLYPVIHDGIVRHRLYTNKSEVDVAFGGRLPMIRKQNIFETVDNMNEHQVWLR